jgi:hypothetical protein
MPEKSNCEEPNTRYKLGRVLSEYDLLGLHGDLAAMWLGDDTEERSLRELAEHTNVAILDRAMEEVGTEPLEGEAENAYRLLTDDDVSAGVRTQQRNRLERAGIDPDELESNFVTHQAVYTYLTEVLDVSKDDDTGGDPIEKHRERVQRLRNRTAAVVDNSLSELQQRDIVPTGSLDATVSIQVYCNDCQTQVSFVEFLNNQGCDCR